MTGDTEYSVFSSKTSSGALLAEEKNEAGKGMKRLKSLAMKPTRSAAIIVPSLTPTRCPEKAMEVSAAMAVRDTSKQTLVIPNSNFHVDETARTKDSPGSIATLARTSVYTPKPSIRQPMSSHITDERYSSGCTNVSSIIVRSMKYPKTIETGI